MQRNKRKSNFELLRIVSIFFILCFHCVFHSGFEQTTLDANLIVVKSFYFLGELGVTLFILIMGYFQINSKFRLEKLYI